jgi:hypothetical protein
MALQHGGGENRSFRHAWFSGTCVVEMAVHPCIAPQIDASLYCIDLPKPETAWQRKII